MILKRNGYCSPHPNMNRKQDSDHAAGERKKDHETGSGWEIPGIPDKLSATIPPDDRPAFMALMGSLYARGCDNEPAIGVFRRARVLFNRQKLLRAGVLRAAIEYGADNGLVVFQENGHLTRDFRDHVLAHAKGRVLETSPDRPLVDYVRKMPDDCFRPDPVITKRMILLAEGCDESDLPDDIDADTREKEADKDEAEAPSGKTGGIDMIDRSEPDIREDFASIPSGKGRGTGFGKAPSGGSSGGLGSFRGFRTTGSAEKKPPEKKRRINVPEGFTVRIGGKKPQS